MGVIFRKRVRLEALTTTMVGTISTHMHAALAEPPPSDPQEMQKRVRTMAQPAAEDAARVAAQPDTETSTNWTPFFISLGLFLLVLAIAITVDRWNMVDDPTPYSGIVPTVLGVVLGFLMGDAMGAAMSVEVQE